MRSQAEYITKALNGKWYGSYGNAFCPCHDNRRTPALSVSQGDNDTLLVYCHAGCNPIDILKTLNQRGFLKNYQHIQKSYQDKPKQSDHSDYINQIISECQYV